MIVGNGLIASYFKQHSNYETNNSHVIFASGISSSLNVTDENINRECKLVDKILKETKKIPIIYFSSSFVGFVETKYYQHKLNMERYIQDRNESALIVRIPQLVGRGGNPENFFNFVVNKVKNGEPIITSNNTCRSLIDVVDLVSFVDVVKYKTGVINFSHIEITSVVDICNFIGDVVGLAPVMNFMDTDNQKMPNNSEIVEHVITKLNINKIGYNKRIIEKYVL